MSRRRRQRDVRSPPASMTKATRPISVSPASTSHRPCRTPEVRLGYAPATATTSATTTAPLRCATSGNEQPVREGAWGTRSPRLSEVAESHRATQAPRPLAANAPSPLASHDVRSQPHCPEPALGSAFQARTSNTNVSGVSRPSRPGHATGTRQHLTRFQHLLSSTAGGRRRPTPRCRRGSPGRPRRAPPPPRRCSQKPAPGAP